MHPSALPVEEESCPYLFKEVREQLVSLRGALAALNDGTVCAFCVSTPICPFSRVHRYDFALRVAVC